MTMKKLCPHCNKKLIDYADRYCDECKDIVDTDKKEQYKDYKKQRTDKKEQSFYNSKSWIQLRQAVMAYYKGLDIYEYYVNHKIVYADIIHHLTEIKDVDGWDKRLVFSNMFPCSKATHNLIHSLYDKDKIATQELLLQLVNRFNKEFNSNSINE
jgi:hypothetical protein